MPVETGLPPLDPDFLQAAWRNPGAYQVVYRGVLQEAGGAPGGLLIALPDQMPATDNHLLLATIDKGMSYYDLPDPSQTQMMKAALVFRRRIQEEFRPGRAVSLQHFGVGINYPHWHILPRDQRSDGSAMYQDRPRASAQALAVTRSRLLHPGTNGSRLTYETIATELSHLGYVALRG